MLSVVGRRQPELMPISAVREKRLILALASLEVAKMADTD